MRHVSITLATLAASVCVGCAAPQDTPELSPELQVLTHFMGTWDESVTSKPTARSANETKMSVLTHRRWTLGGKIARAVGTWQPAGTDFIHLWGYDPVAKEYRSWYYDSSGGIPRGTIAGTWDEKTLTMTWNSTDAAGNRTVGTERAIDEAHYEWSHVVTTPDGKIVLDLHGKCTRRPDADAGHRDRVTGIASPGSRGERVAATTRPPGLSSP